jgi:hypothetical protein
MRLSGHRNCGVEHLAGLENPKANHQEFAHRRDDDLLSRALPRL